MHVTMHIYSNPRNSIPGIYGYLLYTESTDHATSLFIYKNCILYKKSANRYTLWKENYPCYTLPPVFSSSGHHSDGVVCVALEVSESDLSCCWVTELQGGLTTSLRTVGDMSCAEAVMNWAWTSPLPCYPDTWGPCELNSDISGSRRGWGDTVIINYTVNSVRNHMKTLHTYLLLVEKPL